MKAETDRLLSEILTLHPKEQRHIFMSLWRHSDGLNEGLSADDCIEIFATALKGSSDFDYELLARPGNHRERLVISEGDVSDFDVFLGLVHEDTCSRRIEAVSESIR